MASRAMENEAECSSAKNTEVAVAASFTFTMDDYDILECPICSHPLRPPVFQCTVGHAICSSCHDKVSEKCHFCALPTVYNRCYVLERVIESIKVACSNGNHGCTARMTYYQKEEHEKSCPHAPCFCSETGCGFSGTTVALLDHFCGQHKWHSSNLKYNHKLSIHIKPGSTILAGEDGNLFLVNMLLNPRGAIIISVCSIQPHDTGSKFECDLSVKTCFVGQYMKKIFYTRSTNLYNGLPTGCDEFYLPNNLLRGATTMLDVTLIKPE